MTRKPLDSGAAMAQGVDKLLREFRGLGAKAFTPSAVAAPSGGQVLAPTVTVAAVDAHPANYAAATYKCNGANDQVEIEAALDYVETLGGGLVQLTEGTFSIAGEIQASTATYSRALRGMGMDITILESQENATAGDNLIDAQQLHYVADLSLRVKHTGYTLIADCVQANDDLRTLYENVSVRSSSTATADGFYLRNNVTLLNCVVETGHLGDYGIRIAGKNAQVLFAHVDGAATHGIYGAGSLSPDSLILGNICENCGTYGIYMLDDDPIIIGNRAPDGIYIGSGAPNARWGGNVGTVTDNGPSSVSMDNDASTAAEVSPLTTKADLWSYSTVDARLGVGSAGDRLTPDTGEATGLRWDTPASAELYLSSAAETTITTGGVAVKAAGTTVLETTPAAVGFTMPSSNRLTYGGTETKKFLVVVTFSASSAAAAKMLGFHLAENGTVNAKTSIERYVGSANEKGAGGIQGLFEMATNDYVEMFVSNETTPASSTNLTIEHMTMTVTEVP